MAIVYVTRYIKIHSFFSETKFSFRFIRKRIQLKLFVHQADLLVRYEKNFQGEIAIRSQDIAINKKAPLECSHDRATHLNKDCCFDPFIFRQMISRCWVCKFGPSDQPSRLGSHVKICFDLTFPPKRVSGNVSRRLC